jgi:hypothetical protein
MVMGSNIQTAVPAAVARETEFVLPSKAEGGGRLSGEARLYLSREAA